MSSGTRYADFYLAPPYMITLPNTLSADIASSTSGVVAELSPLLVLVIGVLLAGVLISIIIGALHSK